MGERELHAADEDVGAPPPPGSAQMAGGFGAASARWRGSRAVISANA
mgnify:CR=1 FL=1